MDANKTAGMKKYLALIISNMIVFAFASLLFFYVFKMRDAVPVFIMFGFIQCLSMILFAVLPPRFKSVPRKVSMILVGGTLLILAGIFGRQNFQVEGFLFLLAGASFGGAIIHFGMKIAGTFFTGRAWCSWGCWSAAVFDFLPYKTSIAWDASGLKYLRYVHLGASVLLVCVMAFIFGYSINSTSPSGSAKALYWFVAGNALYYCAGILLAFAKKDNRAFCKYLCPVAVLLKAANVFSLVRISSSGKCSGCGKCEDACPSAISISQYAKNSERIKSTECVMCMNCVAACPGGNLSSCVKTDAAFAGKLNLRK